MTLAVAEFVRGSVAYDPRTGGLFQLNETAADALRLMRAGYPLSVIGSRIADKHAVDLDVALRDVGVLAEQVQAMGLFASADGIGRRAALPPDVAPDLDGYYNVCSGNVVRVSIYSRYVAAAFGPLAAPARVQTQDVKRHLALFRHYTGFLLTINGQIVDHAETAPLARWTLVRRIIQQDGQWLALLHAGAVVLPSGKCILLCGDAGAGKSSLTAALVGSGFPFMSDDIVPIERGNWTAWPTRLAISIKAGGWPSLAHMFSALMNQPFISFGGRSMKFLWPTNVALRPSSPIAIVFPRYIRGKAISIRGLKPTETLIKLGEGGSTLPQTDHSFAEFLTFVKAVPAFEMAYSSLRDAIDVVESRFA